MVSVKTNCFRRLIVYSVFVVYLATVIDGDKNKTYAFEDLNGNDSLDKCMTKIIKEDFACDAFITLVYSKSDVNKLIEAINNDKCYTVNVRSFVSRDWLIRNEIYIIITEDFTELTEGLDQLKDELFWNPRAHFIISINDVTDSEMQTLFQHFLILKMHKVVLLHNKNKETYVHTYHPFHDGNCGELLEDIENLGSCSQLNLSGYFPQNVATGLKNCKFKAIKFYANSLNETTKMPILEQFIVDTFATSFNYSIEYKVVKAEINFGVVFPNRTITGLLGQLQRNVADIAIGSTVIIKNRADVFDFICGFKIASFKLYTSGLGKEMWKKVYKEFDSETWLIILLFYIFMVVVCIMLLKISPKITYSSTYLIVNLWGFFLGNGTEPYPKSGRLKSVTAFWIWFTFFISSFYNSDMYGLITGHVQRKQQIDPEKLSTIPYRPCISTVIATFFVFAYNEKLPKSVNIPECRSIDGAFKAVANGFDLYTVQLKESYLERERHFVDNEGNRKLDAWDFSSDIVLGFYLNKGFPVKDELHMHAQRMYETGLVDNYQKNLNPSAGQVDRRKKNVAKPFILADFRVHFGVLFLGTILSILTFVVEILYNRKRIKDFHQATD